jgi:hypothetical protein
MANENTVRPTAATAEMTTRRFTALNMSRLVGVASTSGAPATSTRMTMNR